jgi:quinol monooxygenase YgiN
MSSIIKSLVIAVTFACAATLSFAQQVAPVVVLVKVFPTAGRENELQALYLKRLEYLRKAEPDATFRLHRSMQQPSTFLWYEVYPSQAAYEHHVKVVLVDFKKETGPTPDGIIAKPSESETFTELGR